MPLPPLVPSGTILQTPPRIQVAKYVRNGIIPHAVFETELANSTNFAAGCRRKEIFRGYGNIASIPNGVSSDRIRWRFAAHTGPLLASLRVIFYMARQNAGDPVFDPTATLIITNADESTTYGSASVHFGASPLGGDDVPSEFGLGEVFLTGVPASTMIYGKLVESDQARLISATVYEEALGIAATTGYVYPPTISVGAPILDDRRQTLYENARDMWTDGAAHLFNWTADIQASPATTTSTSDVNIIDGAAIVDDTAAGYTIDTTYCGTRSRPGTVPCVFAVRAKVTGGTGHVYLSDALGGALATVDVTATSETWHTVTVDLDANYQKVHISHDAWSGQTTSTYAVSLFQLA